MNTNGRQLKQTAKGKFTNKIEEDKIYKTMYAHPKTLKAQMGTLECLLLEVFIVTFGNSGG